MSVCGRRPRIVRSEIVTTWLNASFEMRFRLIGGLTVRFAVSQEQTDHALLLSPWPESLLAFEPVWWRLAKRAQLVAMDLPGFGHSQRSDSLLSPQAMGGFRRDDPRRLVTAALSGISRYTLPESVRDDYLASYQGNRFAESVRYLRSYPAELPVLAGLLPQIGTPVQIIAGADDTAVPPVNATFLHERLPHSKLDVLDAGHFTWEDSAVEYAGLVADWWRSGSNGSRK